MLVEYSSPCRSYLKNIESMKFLPTCFNNVNLTASEDMFQNPEGRCRSAAGFRKQKKSLSLFDKKKSRHLRNFTAAVNLNA